MKALDRDQFLQAVYQKIPAGQLQRFDDLDIREQIAFLEFLFEVRWCQARRDLRQPRKTMFDRIDRWRSGIGMQITDINRHHRKDDPVPQEVIDLQTAYADLTHLLEIVDHCMMYFDRFKEANRSPREKARDRAEAEEMRKEDWYKKTHETIYELFPDRLPSDYDDVSQQYYDNEVQDACR